tara:strand:- start:702 stop:1439 length:738 start_codon:yes stop_codon:yes gene_type:complete
MLFPFKAVLFDWAYTLVDLVSEDDRKAFRALSNYMRDRGIYDGDFATVYDSYRELFYEMIDLSLETHREACFEHVLKYFLIKLGIFGSESNYVEELLEVYYKSIYESRIVYQDTIPALEALKTTRTRLGIISNTTNPGFMKDWERRQMGLDDFFELSIYSSEVPYRKPHQSIFNLAVYRMKLEPEEILFVGDNLQADVGGAQGAGMYAVWLNRSGQRNPGNIKPDYEITSLSQLTEVVSRVRKNN